MIDMESAVAGGVQMWFNGNGTNGPDWVGYGFGNIIYNTSGSNIIDIGITDLVITGTYYIFNNIVDCTNGCGDHPPNGPYSTVYENNNYYIGGTLSFTCGNGTNGCSKTPWCVNGSGAGCTDLDQTKLQAILQGYKPDGNFPISRYQRPAPL